MYKKEKNIIIPAKSANLTGTESGLKTGSSGSGADFKIGSIKADLKTNPAGESADVKTIRDCNSIPGGNAAIKAGDSISSLSGKLYLLILIGLSVAVLLLLAGFSLNFFKGDRDLNLNSLQENALAPADLIDAIKNNQMPSSLVMGYAGLLAIILVPAAGLIYIIGHFFYRKIYNLALAAAGVLFILILSAVIGLLKS
jgi:hypothetical protein